MSGGKELKKKFLKIFFLTFLIGVLLTYGLFYTILNSISVKDPEAEVQIPKERINALIVGVANGLSDTLMFVSYDMKNDKIDIMSIPRDTYFPRDGYKHPAQKKINAAYGNGGSASSLNAVEKLLNEKIHYYFEFNYKAVISAVDAIGGISVEVPHNMDYDDPVDKLHIHFKKGQVVERGEDIVKLLRWRKNNRGGGYGDLGRIEMQQHIIKLGFKKMLSGNIASNFLKIQEPIKDNVKTNMTLKQMMYMVKESKNIKEEKIYFHTLPGKTKTMEGLSFFIADEDKLKMEMDQILNIAIE